MNKNVLLILLSVCFCFAPRVEADHPLFDEDSVQYDNVRVVRLIKSDILVLENDKKIRLIGIKGIDAPRKRSNRPADEYGFVIEEDVEPTTSVEERASQFAEDLLEQKKVRVESDVKATDSEGYRLGYVFLPDGTMANAELLRQGYAELHIQPPNVKYADQLREAYREARFEKRGIHAE